jgi:glycosyltransferase involved in cell wall biosynthesis
MRATSEPRLSLIIPTFNRAGMLAEALDSALAQTYPHLEIIVSDNASTDGTAELMARYQDPRLRYHRNSDNLGMVGNWRQAIRDLASGDFFLLLSDDDCLLEPDYLARAAQLIQDHPDVVVVYGEGWLLDTLTDQRTELRLPFQEVEPGPVVFASRNTVSPQDFILCNVLFHRRLALELDAFADPLDLCCDSELFLKLCVFGQVGVLKGRSALYRLHGGNLIKTIQGNPDLLAHSMNMYLAPHRLALDKGVLSARQRSAFESTARIALMRSVLVMREHHPDRYRAFVASLRATAPELMRQLYRWPRFQRKLLTLRVRLGLKHYWPGSAS